MTSILGVDNFKPATGGTSYSARGVAKAWVNFDGTGTVAIRDSENVSSITDDATGKYKVNYINNMADTNSSYASNGREGFSGDSTSNRLVTSRRIPVNVEYQAIGVMNFNSSFTDIQEITAQTFGDLA